MGGHLKSHLRPTFPLSFVLISSTCDQDSASFKDILQINEKEKLGYFQHFISAGGLIDRELGMSPFTWNNA